MTDEELKNLVSELNDKLNEIYQLDPMWKKRGEWKQSETGSIVYPPASNKDINNLEKRLRKELPPSYARFLRLHNGWKHFWEDFTLIGATGEHTEEALAKIHETKAWQKGFVKNELEELTLAKIKEWEGEWEGNIYLENHLVFGTNFAGSLYVFDDRTRQVDGEMTIWLWPFAGDASVEKCYANFEEMLGIVSKDVDKYLARLKRKSKRKKEEVSDDHSAKGER